MPINYKVKQLYDALKEDGADVGSEQEFNDWFFKPGDEGYKNRRSVYDAFKEDGADIGKDYGEFAGWLGLHAVEAQKQSPALTQDVRRPQAPLPQAATSVHAAAQKPAKPQPVQRQQTAQQPVTYFRLRRGGKDFNVSADEVRKAGGLQAWANRHPGAPVRVYMQGNGFNGHVDLSQAHNRYAKQGYKYSTTTAKTPVKAMSRPEKQPTVKPAEQPMTDMQKEMLLDNLQGIVNNARSSNTRTIQQMKNKLEYDKKSRNGFLGGPVEGGVQYNPSTGKMEQTYLTPQGYKTTSKGDADMMSQQYREQQAFRQRMKVNGLKPDNKEDVQKQMQLDEEKPMRDVLNDVWGEAEAQDKKAQEAWRNRADKNARGFSLSDAAAASSSAGAVFAGRGEDFNNDLEYQKKRHAIFDFDKMANTMYARLPEDYRRGTLERYTDYFKKHPKDAKGKTAAIAAKDALMGDLYRQVYERAKAQDMPKSKLEFLLRKIADQPLISSSMAANTVAAWQTGSHGLDLAEQDAMSTFGKQHKTLDIAGTVANMALDPVTYAAGGVGGVVGKKALQAVGKQALKGATKKVAERYAAGTLAGRVAQGAAGGAANFGTFNTVKGIQQQMAVGGTLDENGKPTNELSAGDILKETAHGLMLGAATGTLSPLIGNVADKAVKATSSTAGKVALRAGQTALSTLAEGTVFAIPDMVDKGKWDWDTWTDSQAMMLGFKASHAIKSAPRVLQGLQREDRRIGLNFEERLRKQLDASPADIGFKPEEMEELRDKGYTDLSMLFRDANKRKADKSTGIEERTDDYENLTPDRFDGYEAMKRLMNDNSVSEATRAKAYYILTGHMLPMSSVVGYDVEKDDAGRVTVNSVNARGGVVTTRRFANEKAAGQEIDNIARQAELNAVNVGEKYKETASNMIVMEQAIKEVAPDADVATVLNNYKMVKSGQLTDEAYVRQAQAIDEAIARNRHIADPNRPEAIREKIKKETGIDVDASLRKMPAKRTEKEQAVVDEYIRSLFPEEKAEKPNNGGYEQIEPDAHYNRGYKSADDESGDEMRRVKTDYDTKRNGMADKYGEDNLAAIDDDPIGWLDANADKMSDEDAHVVTDYVNARYAYLGMTQRANDDADDAAVSAAAAVDARANKDDNMVHPATLKDGGNVYIVSGNVVMSADGKSVDKGKSSKRIVVRDAQSGEMSMLPADDVIALDAPIDAQQERDAAAKAAAEQSRTASANAADGLTTHDNPQLGDEVYVRGDDGKPVRGIIRNVDSYTGDYMVETEAPIAGKKAQPFKAEQLYDRVQDDTDADTVADMGSNAIDTTIPTPDDSQSQPQQQQNSGETSTDAEQPETPAQPEDETEHQPQTEELQGSEQTAEVGQPASESEEAHTGETPARAIDKIPSEQVTDKKGNTRTVHHWEQAPAEDTYDAMTQDVFDGDAKAADDYAAGMAERLDKEIKKLDKEIAKSKTGESLDDILEAKKRTQKLRDQREALQQRKKYWQNVRNVPVERNRAKAEDEARAAARAQAEAEANDLASVPEWGEDTPQAARDREFRRESDHKIERQKPLKATTGNEVDVRFSQKDVVKGKVAVVDASQLQASHVNRRRNPRYFLDEAQPKERTDEASLMASHRIAQDVRPAEITGSATAYSGAPVVNSRGEVIQGNNRTDALKRMYDEDQYKESAEKYKQYLMDHAEEFGLNPEDIAKMKHPVLVNMVDVSDEEAIRLGQMSAADTESGGVERIRPQQTRQKMDDRQMGVFLRILLNDGNDQTLSISELIANNGIEAVKYLHQIGAISDTQMESAVSNGALTDEAKTDIKNLLFETVFHGAPTTLREIFNSMPKAAQRAILATAWRDASSDAKNSMIGEIQKSIYAWNDMRTSFGEELKASKSKENTRLLVGNWMQQLIFNTATGQPERVTEKYSNFAIELATRYFTDKQTELQDMFNALFDQIQGTSDNLFDPEGSVPKSLGEAIKKVLGIDYKPLNKKSDVNRKRQTGSNGVDRNDKKSEGGQSGSAGDTEGGEQGPQGARAADSGRGTKEDATGRQPRDLAEAGNGTGQRSGSEEVSRRSDAGVRQSGQAGGLNEQDRRTKAEQTDRQSGEGRPGSTGDGAGRERAAGAGQHADVAGGDKEDDGLKVDKQGNPVDGNGKLITEKVRRVEDVTDEDFVNPSRSIELPTIPKKVADAIGTNGKPIIIKKNIFEKNSRDHADLTPEQSREILTSALYRPDLYGQNRKTTRPYNWIVINTKDEQGHNRLVLLEVNQNKDNVEIVHWHYLRDDALKSIERQAKREGGHILILPSSSGEEAGGLPGRTQDLSSAAKVDNSSESSDKKEENVGDGEENGDKRIVSDGDFNVDDIDFEHNYVVIHQTMSRVFDSILRDGLHTAGGLLGTSLFGNRENIEDTLKAEREGHGHKGSDGLIIMQFPKSWFNGRRIDLDDISIELSDRFGPDAILTVPPQFITHAVVTSKMSEEEKEQPKAEKPKVDAAALRHGPHGKNGDEERAKKSSEGGDGGEEYEKKAAKIRAEEILKEGLPEDAKFGTKAPSDIKSVEDIENNVTKIISGLKDAEEGKIDFDNYDGYVHSEGYDGNAGEQLFQYINGLREVTPELDKIIYEWAKKHSLRDVYDTVEYGKKFYQQLNEGHKKKGQQKKSKQDKSMDKASGAVEPVTEEEAELRDAVAAVLRKAGIEVIGDDAEGQRVLDMENGRARLQASWNGLKKASNFILSSLSGKAHQRSTKIEIPERANRLAEKAIGHPIVSHSIRADELRHIEKRHGANGTANDKNSIPLRKEDIALMPYIMAAPTRVVKGTRAANGTESVRYEKDLSNGTVLIVEREGRFDVEDMENITMWAQKKPATNVTVAQGASHSTSETIVISETDAAKIRKDAEEAVKKDEKLREQRVYHGSGADSVRFFRTADGEAYGFTVGGKIYIDPRIAKADTPIHEYAHLWAEALRKANPKEWQNVVGLMKQCKAVWEQVKREYPELTTDDEIADEVLAHYSGKRGAERLRAEMRKAMDGEKSMIKKAGIARAFDALRDSIKRFWKHISEDILHIHFTSADEVADKVLYDLLNKVKPGTHDQLAEERAEIERRAKEDGTWMKAPNGKESNLTEEQWVTVRTRQFKDWFGDWENDPEEASQAVDENGEPKVFYHNTDNDFTVFDANKNGTHTDAGWLGDGFYFYGDENEGNGYGHKKMGVFLNARNLYYASSEENEKLAEANNRDKSIAFRNKIEDEGYDAVYYNGDLRQEAVVFYPEQIKSATDNVGTFDAANPDIRYQFVGEKGAASADRAEEATTRLDNLSVARKMEEAGKDAHNIKMATGWERGADEKWRYEIPDFRNIDPRGNIDFFKNNPDYKRYFDLIAKSNKAYFFNGEFTKEEESELSALDRKLHGLEYQTFRNPDKLTLKDYMDAPELFKAYPQLRNLPVKIEALPDNTEGAYTYQDGAPVIKISKGIMDSALAGVTIPFKRVMAHEIQHAIQLEEGFAKGGSIYSVRGDIEDNVSEMRPSYDWTSREGSKAIRLKNAASKLEFAKKIAANPEDYVNDPLTLVRLSMNGHKPLETIKKMPDADKIAAIKRLASDYWWEVVDDFANGLGEQVGMELPHNPYPEDGSEMSDEQWEKVNKASRNVPYADEMIAALRKRASAIEDYVDEHGMSSEEMSDYLRKNRALERRDDTELYASLAGEVEARNAARRVAMTDEQRRRNLASDTEDVSREDQIYLYDSFGIARSEEANDNGKAHYRDGEESDIEAVNKRFNKELERYEKGETPVGTRFDLGMPSKELESAGFPYLPISMRASLLSRKAGTERHPFEASDLRDLVKAMQKPIAIFKYSKENMRNLIVDVMHGGKHFLVGVTLDYKAGDIEVNSVSGLFPKESHEWIKWIQDGKAIRIDQKKKVLDLIDSLRTNPAESERIGLNLSSAAKIVEDFENPVIKGENVSDEEENNSMKDAPTTPAEAEEGDVLYREVDDEEQKRLDNEPTVKVYRAMQEHDGKLYPPMSGRVREQYTTKNGVVRNRWVWRAPITLGKWEQSEEHPEMANEDGTFTLDKGNGSTINAAYNPYIHTSRTPINDQFSSAWSRPELVTVEVEVPESELTSGYRAEKAKDATGEVEWKSGPVGREMAAQGKPRMVILSRWDKPIRIVPVEEVADEYAKRLQGTGISVPFNTVPPALREALVARGVEISEPEKGNAGAASRQSYEEWLRGERRSMEDAVRELAQKLHLNNVEIVTEPITVTDKHGRKHRPKGYFNPKTGKITISIANNADVDDAVSTLLHEAVAHYGLRQLLGENFDTFLDNVFANVNDDIRKKIEDAAKKRYDGDTRTATEEYLASLAEDENFEEARKQGVWDKIKDLFFELLHKVGVKLKRKLTDNDLRYMLWRSYENLKEGKGGRTMLQEAADAAKRDELGIRNEAAETASQAEENREVGEKSRLWGKHDMVSLAERAAAGEDPELLFRDSVGPQDETARKIYDKRADAALMKIREAWQDSMINVKNLQDAVLEQRGEKIEDWENAYMQENNLHGVSRAESECFTDNFYKPLLEEVNKAAKGWYDRRTGRITIVAGNHTSVADAESTLLHEAVAHYGLRQLLGDTVNLLLAAAAYNFKRAKRSRFCTFLSNST